MKNSRGPLAMSDEAAMRSEIRWPERGQLTTETGRRLREARLAAGLSLRQVHRLTGISAGFLSELERSLKRPTMTTTEALLRVIPVDPELERAFRLESVVGTCYRPASERHPGWQPRVQTGADCDRTGTTRLVP